MSRYKVGKKKKADSKNPSGGNSIAAARTNCSVIVYMVLNLTVLKFNELDVLE